MAAITAAGTGSGLDIESIIETLTNAERIPTQTRLDTREIEVQAEISAFGSLKSTLKDFQAALSDLSTVNKLAARSASTTNESIFTATASSGAAVGSTDIKVMQLASNHKLVSNGNFASTDEAVGAGQLTIDMGGSSFSLDIVAGTNNTLIDIRDAINDSVDNPGVTASILTVSDGAGGTRSELVLTADETGADNAITITVTGDADGNDTDDVGLSRLINANMTEKTLAQDAEILIDGEYTAYSSTNVFQDAIQGVSITVTGVNDPDDPDDFETLSVGLDKSIIQDRLQKFVDEFNLLSETLNYLTDYDIEAQEAGLLTGDFVARTIETQIRRTIGSAIEGASSVFSSFASIGITTQRDGSLALDGDKLNSALNSNFDDVAELLAGDDGIISSLDDKLDSFLSSDGIIASRNATFQSQIEDINEQRAQLDLRIESFEKRIRLQYTNLDILVGQLQSTGDFVTQQLDVIKKGLTGKD